MKKTLMSCLIALLFCGLSSTNLNAQAKFGKVTNDELEMSSYSLDPTASAVILSKIGKTSFSYNDIIGSFQYEYTLETRIKILSEEGLELCNNEIYYTVLDRYKENVRSLAGTTYNLENGKVVKTKLSKEYIFDESEGENLKVKKFTMPAAKVGSVIEFKYIINSPFDYNLPSFNFQSYVPTAYAQYDVIIPEYYRYNVNMQGYESVSSKTELVNQRFTYRFEGYSQPIQDDCSATKRTFIAKDMPALKDEPHVWAKKDYLSRITFELQDFQFKYGTVQQFSTSWDKIDDRYLKSSSFTNNLNRDVFKNEITKGELTLENAHKIETLIKSRIQYNRNSGRNFFSAKLSDALKNGSGNSTEMNFLLISALNSAGFQAYPVMLSTRKNGRIPFTHPSATAFNHMITCVIIDEKAYFTDASDIYGSWNILAEKCMVTQARVLKKDASGWVNLSNLSPGTLFITSNYTFENGQFVGKITDSRRTASAYNFKENFYIGNKDKEEYVDKFKAGFTYPVEDYELSGENTTGDIKVTYTIKPELELGDEFIYINPMYITHLNVNPFIAEERKLPINFPYLENYIQMIDIAIPEGYAVEELPKSEKLIFGDDAGIALTYNVTQSETNIKIHYQFKLNKLLVIQTEYDVLRDYYAKVVLKNTEQIVLKKVAK